MSTEYRIEFQIQRMTEADDDFVEIGFGSTGGWQDIEQAAHILGSMTDNGEWETEGEQPAPDDVLRQIQRLRDATE